MVRDRLAELNPQQSSSPNQSVRMKNGTEADDVQIVIVSGSSKNDYCEVEPTSSSVQLIDESLKRYDELGLKIEQLRQMCDRIRGMHAEILATPELPRKTQEEAEELIKQFRQSALQLTKELKSLESQMKLSQKEEEKQFSVGMSTRLRIDSAHISRLGLALSDLTRVHNNELVHHQEMCRNRIKRQVETAGQSMSDDAIDEALESGSITGIYTKNIFADTQHIKNVVAEVEDRFSSVKNIEKDIELLKGLFEQLAVLTEQQGALVDNVESQVEKSRDHVVGAQSQLKGAEESARKYRRRTCICVIVAFVAVGIIAIIIAISVCTSGNAC